MSPNLPPLIYWLEGKGILLFSIGPNGVDVGGRGAEDDPRGDDLSVRLPVPRPRGRGIGIFKESRDALPDGCVRGGG
jgi:hypothetical protein